MGSVIIGEAVGDGSGLSVSLSDDGKIVAIGATNNDGGAKDDTFYNTGHVRIYNYTTGGSWVQMGGDIDGEARGDYSGHSVSLSSDGTVVAIGDAGPEMGVETVRIYNYSDTNGGTWVQMGGDIDGEKACDESGRSVSLSNDGKTVAIGASYNDNAEISAGHVRIYNYNDTNGGEWVQMGGDIDGEGNGDNLGYSVSLSSDGTVVAIGAINYGSVTVPGQGQVKIYTYSDTTGGSWAQMGGDINGESAYSRLGWSVSLSSDGKTVAIGAPGFGITYSGHVRIYSYSNIAGGGWLQKGGVIDGESSYDQTGWSVSLSGDGTIVAIGARSKSSAGHVYTYRSDTNPSSWNQMGSDIDGEGGGDELGHSVSLSNDGKTVAIGSHFATWFETQHQGYVRIYNWH